LKTYSAEAINHATTEAGRLYHDVQRAYRWVGEGTDCTLAGERAAVTQLQAAVHAYAAWLAQDTRPATAPSWTIVGADTDGHIVGPLDEWEQDLPTVY
jgi:hypothetical protein